MGTLVLLGFWTVVGQHCEIALSPYVVSVHSPADETLRPELSSPLPVSFCFAGRNKV